MPEILPFIDIIVPSYNRPIDIKKFVQEIQLQKYPTYKIWVIDDCGSEDLTSIVPDDSRFTLIRLPENKGQAYARNVALTQATGDIVISLDDDSWFDNDTEALYKVVEYFNVYIDTGCLAFNISTPDTQYNRIKGDGREVALHITCGCAYRSSTLKTIGGFSGFLHSMAEESDLSLKIIGCGYSIRYASRIKVFHNFQPLNRSMKWYLNTRYNTTRNDLLIVVMRYPTILVLPFVVGKFLSHLRFSITCRQYYGLTFIYTLGAFIGFIKKSPTALRMRKPLNYKQFKHWRELLAL